MYDTKEQIEAKGTWYGDVFRWDSNGAVPFDDLLVKLGVTPQQLIACRRARDIDQGKALDGYREAMLNRTPEEVQEQRMQARAAMGAGVEMVDIITGERWRT